MQSKRSAAITATLTLGAMLTLGFASSAYAQTSITDRLSAGHAAVEVTSEPPGTTEIHVAVMSNLAGDGIGYLDIPALQVSYVPAPGAPVVDVQAFGVDGPIGGWAGRLQTTQAEEGQDATLEGTAEGSQEEAAEGSQEEAAEGSQEEAAEGSVQALESTQAVLSEKPEELLGVARAHKVSKKKKRREEEKKRREEEEREGPPERMVVGVDSGGWEGASTFADLAKGGVTYIRTSNAYANQVEPESHAAGVHIATVVFGTGGSIAAISPSAYAAEVKSYFAKYGQGGALAVEVLNEPGNNGFWSDPTDYTGYAKLAKAVHEALATLPVASRPVELCSWDGGEASPYPDKAWGEGIKAAGALPYCDGVTAHPYGGKTGGDGGALGGRTDVELAHSESGKPVYVTEIGWPTAVGQPSTGDSQQWTEAQQAANITGFMKWADTTGYVPMVIYFNYVDYGTNDYYGIETAARRHKLGFAALAEASARW
jgi:hypothetical protein